jgi:hypothetical protein
MSIAMRLDHGLGVPGYYDDPMFASSGLTHEQRLNAALADARRAYEEVTGQGFYKPEREAEYAALVAVRDSASSGPAMPADTPPDRPCADPSSDQGSRPGGVPPSQA